jgi:hypothetical protein
VGDGISQTEFFAKGLFLIALRHCWRGNEPVQMKRGNSPKKKASEELLEKAIKIAVEAHAGQKDKNGQPYILYPLRVMLRGQTDEKKLPAFCMMWLRTLFGRWRHSRRRVS